MPDPKDPRKGEGGPPPKKRSLIFRLFRALLVLAILAAAGLVGGFKANYQYEVNPDKKWPWEAQTEFKDYARSWGKFLGGKGKEYGQRALEKGKEIDWDEIGKKTQSTLDKLNAELKDLTSREGQPAKPGEPGTPGGGPAASPEATKAYKDGLEAYKSGLEAFHAANKASGDAQREHFQKSKEHLGRARDLLEEAKEKGWPAAQVDEKLTEINERLQDISKRQTL